MLGREMTLDEYVERLRPLDHTARKEYEDLKARLASLEHYEHLENCCDVDCDCCAEEKEDA